MTRVLTTVAYAVNNEEFLLVHEMYATTCTGRLTYEGDDRWNLEAIQVGKYNEPHHFGFTAYSTKEAKQYIDQLFPNIVQFVDEPGYTLEEFIANIVWIAE